MKVIALVLSRTTRQASYLQLSRFEFDAFLKARNIYDHAHDLEDFEQDVETLRQVEARGRMSQP